MKALNPLLYTEQQHPSTTPAIKVQAQAYGHPAASVGVRVNRFDWTDTGYGGCELACMCSDGSLLTKVGTKIRRYADPTANSYTEAVIPTAGVDPPAGFGVGNVSSMIANPTSGEVMLFARGVWNTTTDEVDPPVNVVAQSVLYARSTDYGVTWGNWTAIVYIPYKEPSPSPYLYGRAHFLFNIAACYNDDGDIGIVLWRGFPFYARMSDFLTFIKRKDGSWLDFGLKNSVHPTSSNPTGSVYLGCGQTTQSLLTDYEYSSPKIASVDIAWDGDWFVVVSHDYRTDLLLTFADMSAGNIAIMYVVWGDGNAYPENALYHLQSNNIKMSDADIRINSFSDLREFAIPHNQDQQTLIRLLQGNAGAYSWNIDSPKDSFPVTSDLRQAILSGGGGTYIDNGQRLLKFAETYPNVYVTRTYEGDLVISAYADDKAVFIFNRPDYNILNPVFYNGFAYEVDYPLRLAAGESYIFAYNNKVMYISPIGDWVVPTAGSGAGATYDVPFNKLVNLVENVTDGAPSTLTVAVDNTDDAYDAPGAGVIAALKRGSRINLFMGYTIEGTDYQVEYARYFIDTCGYIRMPNRSLFGIKCIDGFGMLEKYTFNAPIYWNQYMAELDKNYLYNDSFDLTSMDDYKIVMPNGDLVQNYLNNPIVKAFLEQLMMNMRLSPVGPY